jgi:hypothetical protein
VCATSAALVVGGVLTAQAQTTPVLFDPHISVGAGASIAVGAGDLVAQLEHIVVPDRVTAEQGVGHRSANIAYRTAKLLLFDRPQEHWLMVANHEVFGHGGRVRELFGGYLRFHLDVPPPYGEGGGVTYFAPDRDVTVHELQAVTVGGMEANTVGGAALSTRAFRERQLAPREALRYLEFELDAFDYMRHTPDEAAHEGHDVADFIRLYNVTAAAVGGETLTAHTVRGENWINLANPMVASAAFTIGRYLATGAETTHVFTLPIGSWRVMPAMRYRLAPFGPEWEVTTDLGEAAHVGQASFRIGRAPLTSPWGLMLAVDLTRVRGWRIGVSGDFWKQPPLALGSSPDLGIEAIGAELEWGVALRSRVESPAIHWTRFPATFVVEAGGKSSGFVKGEPLDGGLVLRAGLGLPLGRW